MTMSEVLPPLVCVAQSALAALAVLMAMDPTGELNSLSTLLLDLDPACSSPSTPPS